MTLLDLIRSRRSQSQLTHPAPTDEEILRLVTDAATGPDHGRLRPWRLVVVRDQAREALGEAFVADLAPEDTVNRQRLARKPLRAPLLLSIVFAPQCNPKVPEWEQLAATAAVVSNLCLLLHGSGYGAIWRTGAPNESPHVHRLLGLRAPERLLGWLYVGMPNQTATVPPRREFQPHDRIFVLEPAGAVVPLFPAEARPATPATTPATTPAAVPA